MTQEMASSGRKLDGGGLIIPNDVVELQKDLRWTMAIFHQAFGFHPFMDCQTVHEMATKALELARKKPKHSYFME